MVCLSRRVGERIVIGDRIVISVQHVAGQRVRVAIEAPDNVPVWRGETVQCRLDRLLADPGLLANSVDELRPILD
jgi:carbon storage regulator